MSSSDLHASMACTKALNHGSLRQLSSVKRRFPKGRFGRRGGKVGEVGEIDSADIIGAEQRCVNSIIQEFDKYTSRRQPSMAAVLLTIFP